MFCRGEGHDLGLNHVFEALCCDLDGFGPSLN